MATDPDEAQEQRAMRTLMAIYGGADLTEETKKLADEFFANFAKAVSEG